MQRRNLRCLPPGTAVGFGRHTGSILADHQRRRPSARLCLVFRRHAVELHDLTEAEAYLRDIQRVSRIVQEITGAVKMNSEVHGNSLPHLHLHLYPRSPSDPFDGGPIDWSLAKRPVYAPGEFAGYVAAVQAALPEQTVLQ